jgi:hypothetical protein
MSIETLKGLGLLATGNTIDAATSQYYINNFANGSGEFGTFEINDFLGSAIGANSVNNLFQSVSTLNSMNLTALTDIYQDMLDTVNGVYGPFAGNVVITSGPAAGTYANGDLAFSVGLIPNALSIVSGIIASYPTETAALNTAFDDICQQIVDEAADQNQAGLDFDTTQGSRFVTLSFVQSLPNYGVDDTPGGAADFLNTVANVSTQGGQAIVGVMREARNARALDNAGLRRANQVPSNWPGPANLTPADQIIVADQPLQPPPTVLAPAEYQVTNSAISTDYTVLQARDAVAGTALAPTPAQQIEIIGISGSNTLAQQGRVLAASGFNLTVRILPATTSLTAVITSSASSGSLSLPVVDAASDATGIVYPIPGWMVPTVGTATISVSVGSTTASVTVQVVASLVQETVTVTQTGWFANENQVSSGSLINLIVTGQPSTNFVYSGALGSGSGSLAGNGQATVANIAAPPVGQYQISVVYAYSGNTVTQTFLVLG